MASVTVDDPDEHRVGMTVDDRGRVFIGGEHAGEEVTVVVEVQNDGE